jgi:hypothetical protein
MKKLFLLLFVIAGTVTAASAQTKFLDKVETTSPGIRGKVTFSPTAGFKQYSWEDETRVNEGATFELMTRELAKDDIGLYCVKIKILDDNGSGKYNGKVGFMYGASTNLSDNMDYTTGRITGSSPKVADSEDDGGGNFMDRATSTYPKVYGKVTFSPNAGFKSSGPDDSNRVNEGATFELLSREMIKDNIGLYTIKIKIIDDNGSGKYNGKSGYIYPASTTLTDYTDYTEERIVGGPKSLSDVGGGDGDSGSGGFQDRVSSTYPGVKGRVTFSPTAGFKQFSNADNTRVNEGATFELLSREMIKDDIGLYTIKIKITDDNGTGKFNGKIGYMYPASTNLSDYVNYTSERVEGGPKK